MNLLVSKGSQNVALKWGIFCVLLILIYSMNLHLLSINEISVNLVSLSLIIDLSIWVPLVYHFVIVRSGLGPRFITKTLVSVGLLSTFYLLPSGSFLAPLATYYPFMLIAGLAVVATLGITRFIPAFIKSRHMETDKRIEFLAMQTAKKAWIANALKSEWMALYYVIFGWRLARTPNTTNQFSYHQKSGNVGLVIGLSIFQIPGLIFTHIIFYNISPIVAVVLTIGHIYSLYFGLSQAMAMKNRFIKIEGDNLYLRCGLLFDVCIPINMIQSVHTISANAAEEKVAEQIKATFFGFANIRITLKETIKLPIFAGLSKDCHQIIIGLDEPSIFSNLMLSEIQKHTLIHSKAQTI